ncbi:MAG: nucleotide exchange factor GrpE [Planctomycetes bacterium]|nr:nucleotide exchange factor GrpE [Planctomycetota bacterium]
MERTENEETSSAAEEPRGADAAGTPPPLPEGSDPSDASDEAVDPAELDILREKAGEADELKEQWLRAAADLQNLQRRLVRDKDLARRMAKRDLIGSLLPCFDNLERAVASADGTDVDVIVQGVSMVSSEIYRVLKEHGVEIIAPANEVLDPTRHEAVFSRHDDDVEENLILEVHEKGYALGEMVIRPARVSISLGKAPPEDERED